MFIVSFPRLPGSNVKRLLKRSSKRSERKERRGRSLRAAALSAPIETGEEDDLEDDGEEEREVSIPHLEAVFMICLGFFIFQIRMICGMCVP